MGSESTRSRSHYLLNRFIQSTPKFFCAEQPQYDALLVHDDASIPSGSTHAFSHIFYGLVHPASRHITSGYIARTRVFRVGSLRRETRGEPVELPVHVVIDLDETETFEPPRGPGTEISGRVPAVDDHGSISVEPVFRLGLYFSEREIARAGKVVFVELVRREDLHDLRALAQEALNLLTLHFPHLEHPPKTVTWTLSRLQSAARVHMLDEQVIHIAESPILARLGGANSGVIASSKMLCRVAIGRGITAPDMTAYKTLSQV